MPALLTDRADRLFPPHGPTASRRRRAPASRHASPGTADRVVEPGSAGAPSSVDIDLVAETRPGITFARSGGGAPAAGTLLESVEAAGLTPKNRCRRGVCATCTTALVRGSVCDTRTGELVEGPAPIRLCVSVAEGPVTLDL